MSRPVATICGVFCALIVQIGAATAQTSPGAAEIAAYDGLHAAAWTGDIAEAAFFASGPSLDEALTGARNDARNQLVLDPQAIGVELRGTRPVPTKLRERIRADGPSVAYAVPAARLAAEGPDRPASAAA